MVTNLIYTAAGKPPMRGVFGGTCRTCGENGTGLPFYEWVKDTFVDHDKLVAGDIICHACQFCFCESSDLLTSKTGKDKPQRMRNYSHFIVDGEWIPLSKGNKPQMRTILLEQSPDVAVIAVSGQKHIIFRVRPGWWQVEEMTLRPFKEELSATLSLVEELYEGGMSKSEIETGRYLQYRIMEFGVDHWRKVEAHLKSKRGGAALQLAIFLAQKEIETDG